MSSLSNTHSNMLTVEMINDMPPLPYLDELYEESFLRHKVNVNSSSVRTYYLMKRIYDLIQSDYGFKNFDNLYVDDIEIETEINYGNYKYYDILIPNRKYDPNKPECYNNSEKHHYEFSVFTENEIDEELIEYVEEHIAYFTPSVIFDNIKYDKRTKEIFEYDNDDEPEEPEKKFENEQCPVCFCEYTNNEEEDLTNEKEMCCYGCCGHKLCEPCYDTIISSANSRCPECREVWDREVGKYTEEVEYTLDDIQELCENEDFNTLRDIIDIIGVANDVSRIDGYGETLGYEDAEFIEMGFNTPLKYREKTDGGNDFWVCIRDN